MVGPGIKEIGVDHKIWSDHTDIRPTMMSLLGLKDDYTHDGRVLSGILEGWAIPKAMQKGGEFLDLARVYKQIDATVGPFGMGTLMISTQALMSGSTTDDTKYNQLEGQLSALGAQRDGIAAQMISLLEGAEFHNQAIDKSASRSLIRQAEKLLDQVNELAQMH